MTPPDEKSTCRTCGGPIYRHAWGTGQGWGAWMHVTPDHRAAPVPAPAPSRFGNNRTAS